MHLSGPRDAAVASGFGLSATILAVLCSLMSFLLWLATACLLFWLRLRLRFLFGLEASGIKLDARSFEVQAPFSFNVSEDDYDRARKTLKGVDEWP